MSSTGVNIEFYISYDNFLARTNFDDNFTNISKEVYRCNYDNNGNEFLPKIEISKKLTLKQKKALFKEDLYCYEYMRIRSFSNFNDYLSDIETHLNNLLVSDYQKFKNEKYDLENLCGLNFTKNFKLYETRGYTQGDYAGVLVPCEYNCSNIAQIFWDCPISVQLSVNDEEVSLHSVDGFYDVEKEQVIENIKQTNLDELVKEKVLKFVNQVYPDDIIYD